MTAQGETTKANAPSTGCVLKFIAVCGGLVTIITGLITLAGWWERRSQLTAEITSAPFVLPAFATAERDRLDAAIKDRKQIEDALDVPILKKEEKSLLALTVANWLRGIMHFEGSKPLFEPRTVLFAEVKNDGGSTCEAVALTVPDASSARIEKEGRKVEYVDVSGVIELGDLKPKDTVKVTAWTSGYLREDELKIVHRAGIGSILLLKSVSPFWFGVSENWPVVLLLLLLLLFFAVLVVVGRRQQQTDGKAQTAEPPNTSG
jgi:hypothetical protein